MNFELAECMTGSRGQVTRVEFQARNVQLDCLWLENRWVVYLSDRVTEMSLLHHGNMTSLQARRPKPRNRKAKGGPVNASLKRGEKKRRRSSRMGKTVVAEEQPEETAEPVKILLVKLKLLHADED